MLYLPINKGLLRRCLGAGVLSLLLAAPAWGVTTSATKDLTCVGYRYGSLLGCSAGEFTIGTTFSAAPGTPPFCVSGSSFNFLVDLNLYGSNADRYDIGFFVGQQGNDPGLTTAGNICSVATFPESDPPSTTTWADLDAATQPADTCGDFISGGNSIITVNEIKVRCAGDSTGALQVPYLLSYWQNTGNVCTGPDNVTIGTTSKCNKGTSTVSGAVKVFSGAYIDVTKQTSPTGDGQPFSFTASSPGSTVIALVGGVYIPASIELATSSTNVTLYGGQTARIFVNTGSTNKTLTITEAATTFWEPAANISCSPTIGTPSFVVNNGTRTITASNLNATNVAGACTVTNIKRSKITMVKNVIGRVSPSDQFRVEAAGGSTLTDGAGTTIFSPVAITTSGADTTVQTTFWSRPGYALAFTDSATSGSLANYTTTYACSNNLAGSTTVMPNGSTPTFSLTPGAGDDITCTYTNTANKPLIAKSFSPTGIGAPLVYPGDPSKLTLTITNPAVNSAVLTGLAVTDTLPLGMSVAPIPNFSNSCGGVVSLGQNQGDTSLVLSGGGPLAIGASCSIQVDVVATIVGSNTNTTGPVNAAVVGSGGTASAILRITAPASPMLTKLSSPDPVAVNQNALLTFTVTNKTSTTNNMGFTDTLPAGLVVANPVTWGGNCSSTIAPPLVQTATPGGSTITVTGFDLGGSQACTVSINVVSSIPGSYLNNNSNISALAAGLTANVNDTLNVSGTDLSKVFAPAAIMESATSTLTFTIANGPGNLAQSGLAFTETLPAGLTVASAPVAAQCNGTVTAAAGGDTIILAGGSLALGQASCTIAVDVTANVGGTYVNDSGRISGLSAGMTNSVNASLVVTQKATIAKNFSPNPVDVYQPSTMTFTLGNSNSIALSNAKFTDTLTGFYVRTASIGGTCVGVTNNPALVVGATALDLTVPSLPAGGCTITIPVASSSSGAYDNTTSGVTTTETGAAAGAVSNTATLDVNRLPLLLTKVSSSGGTVFPGGAINYSIGYSNPNVATPFLSVVITDPLPDFTTFLSASCGPLPMTIISCGITAPAVGGTGTVTWTMGGSLDAGSSGTVSLSVQVQ